MRLPGLIRTLSALATLSLAFMPLQAQTAMQADRVAASANLAVRSPLAGHLPAWASANADRGTLADSTPVHLVFALSRSAALQSAFDQLVKDQQNPASARYQQWLTPLQVGQQYGPTQDDLNALTAWISSQGLHVDSVEASRTYIQVSGTAAMVSAALQTSLHTYAMPGSTGTAIAPASEPTIPAAFAPVVSFIEGLTQVTSHVHSTTPKLQARSQAGSQAGGYKPDYTSGSTHLLFPADFNTIYDVKAAAAAGITGTGYNISIIGGSRLTASDVTNYESLAALPSYSPNTVVVPGQTDPGTSVDDQTEGQLDFERAYGTAPGAPIDFLIAKNWLTGSVNQSMLLYAINTVNDPVMSLSYGACEAAQTATYIQYENTLFQQAASQGMSVLVSSGDNGAAGCNGITTAYTTYASINDLCANGYVTCVGGTQFSDTASPSSYWSSTNGTGYGSALGYIPEGAWNEPSYVSSTGATVYEAASTGGGFSTNISKPTFQTGTGVPADGQRDVPDISFSASANTDGYVLCQTLAGGDCQSYILVVGGTSAAAPSMAGIAALLDQKLGKRQGNLNTLLYKLAASTPAAFHDATVATSAVSGCSLSTPSTCNNSVPEQTSSLSPLVTGYALTAGFDQATGLGSLDVNAFLNAAATAATLASTTNTLTASPTTITTAQTVVLTDKITSATSGTPSGTVTFTNGSATLATVTLSSGSASTAALSFSTPGTYTISAIYSGDTTFATSTTTLSLVVTSTVPLAATTSTLSATPAAINNTQTTVFTDKVAGTSTSGTPTGTVIFSNGSTTLATVMLSSGSASTSALSFPTAGTYTITAAYSGDATFASSTATLSLSVTSASVTLTPASTTLTTTGGAAVTDAITLTSVNGFAGTETVSCSVSYNGGTGQNTPGCTASPASATLTAGGTAISTITLSSVASSAKTGGTSAENRGLLLSGIGSISLASVLLWVLPRKSLGRVRAARLMASVLLLGALFATVTGCGGGSTAVGGGGGTTGTTKGAYTVTISASGTLSATTTVTLTIQ